MATVEELLRAGVERLRASGSESARLDAELLLGHAVGLDRTGIIAHPAAPVGTAAADRYEAGLARRERGEPIAYIRGIKEFHGLAFATDERALIPRPETELLVEVALSDIVGRLTSAPRPPGSPPISVADIGTGSGAIAVALAVALRTRGAASEVRFYATDVSDDALQLARENAVGHGVADVMRFVAADVLPPVIPGRFDLVLANLPYIPSADVPGLPVAASFEPVLALDGGPDGLDVIRALFDRLPEALAERGHCTPRDRIRPARDRTCACCGALPGLARACRDRPQRSSPPPAYRPPVTVIVADDEAGRERAIEALRRGEVVALPTDTVYGIAVSLRVPGAIDRLFAAKGRAADKAIMLLLAEADQAAEVGVFTPAARVLAEVGWPGGLTLVLRQRPEASLPAGLTGGAPTIGLRLPDHPTPRAPRRRGRAAADDLGQSCGTAGGRRGDRDPRGAR